MVTVGSDRFFRHAAPGLRRRASTVACGAPGSAGGAELV